MKLEKLFGIWGIAAAVCLCAGSIFAQGTNNSNPNGGWGQNRRGGGNFDPAQFQQRMLDNVRDRLAFTNDTDWAAVQPLVQKVFDARRDVGIPGMGMMMRRGGGGGGDNAQGGRRGFFGAPGPEAEALQKAIDDNAPPAQVKSLLEKYRAARKVKEAKLAQAQEDLRKVLTSRQEAEAALLGLLN